MPLAPQAGFMIPLSARTSKALVESAQRVRDMLDAQPLDLYEARPVFRRAIDAIDEHWRAYSQTSLREACFEVPQAALDECELAQPVIFTLQCALVELFKTWGVYPDCVVGHSSGEVAAAYASGALLLADATRLVFHRATLQQRTAGSGRMLAIGLDRPGVEELLDGLDVPFRLGGNRPVQVEIACENAPANTVEPLAK